MQLNLQQKLRTLITISLVLSMILPVAAQAWGTLSHASQKCQVLSLDQHEESQKEENQEDNTKDDKIEMRLVKVNNQLEHSLLHFSLNPKLQVTSQIVVEIPIPPPEWCTTTC